MPFRFLEHTADVRMEVSGKTLPELFNDALKGMTSFLNPTLKEGQEARREFSLDASDVTALLVDFLNEALSLSQLNRETYEEADFKEISETSLRAVLSGRKSESFEEDIKAVTYHEAEVKKTDGGWKTVLVFDI